METKNKDGVFAVVKTDVTEEQVRSLLCSALEGGANYWYLIDQYKFADGVKCADFKKGGRFDEPSDWTYLYKIPFRPGCAVIFSVPEDDDGKTYRLDRDSLTRGLQIMANKYPHHWRDVIGENSDATTGDVFLQLALFGEVIYG